MGTALIDGKLNQKAATGLRRGLPCVLLAVALVALNACGDDADDSPTTDRDSLGTVTVAEGDA
ncbi:MAG: hypothetical protein F4125_06310, partial [Acidimicrobiaceae bacterium]|nr:hypothetical protein [Acidimicrobiaceae bacterium]